MKSKRFMNCLLSSLLAALGYIIIIEQTRTDSDRISVFQMYIRQLNERKIKWPITVPFSLTLSGAAPSGNLSP